MTIKIRYNKTSVHITGLDTANYGPNAGMDLGEGYVRYSPESHCPALTRSGHRMATKTSSEFVRDEATGRGRRVSTEVVYDTPAEALEAAGYLADHLRLKVCSTCAEHVG